MQLRIALAAAVGLAALAIWHFAGAPISPVSAPAKPRPQGAFDVAAHDQLAERVEQARARRMASAPSVEERSPRAYTLPGSSLFEDIPASAATTDAERDKQVVRAAIRSVQPLLRDCYKRHGNGDDGTLELRLELRGEAETGTIATYVRIDGAFVVNTPFVECAHDSLMSISLPEIDIRGIITVDYPLTIGF